MDFTPFLLVAVLFILQTLQCRLLKFVVNAALFHDGIGSMP